jgi:hypothetical protein
LQRKRTVKHEKSREVQSVVSGDGKRFIVRADEKMTALIELEAATRI